MVTLFDTNALIYAFDANAPFHAWAQKILFQALSKDGAAVNPVILAGLCVGDEDPSTVSSRLERIGITFLDLPCAVSQRAGEAFACCLRARKQRGLETDRKIPLPDFFIGAHAELLHLPLATMDVDRYRIYFPGVTLVAPKDRGP